MESVQSQFNSVISLSKAIPFRNRMVVKRDGSRTKFELGKITRAIALAFHEVRSDGAANPSRDDESAFYGLDGVTFQQVRQIAESVSLMLELFYRDGKNPTIEQIQDAAEKAIAAAGEWEVARAFVLYRERHAERRLARYSDGARALADYIAQSKYARYRRDLGRRETFEEGAYRVRDMHRTFFRDRVETVISPALSPDVAELAAEQSGILLSAVGNKSLDDIICEVFEAVRRKEVLPSMRSMQFGGEAVLTNHSRIFNCSFSNVDRLEFFREYFFLLLSGCGVGFSVQKHHVSLLPHLPVRAVEDELEVQHYTIADTIEGWCDALHALFLSHYEGKKIEFNYSLIRPKGAPLKTSGGKAPGHRPLKMALDDVERILAGAAGRALRPIEIYDICMFVARAVLSGGIRRSATICLFSPDDEEMMNAKTGNWFEKNPQRSGSNNSAVIPRSEGSRDIFAKLFHAQKEFGEPGFFFCDNKDGGTNPCAEIGLSPCVSWACTPEEVAKLYSWGYTGDLPGTGRMSGFQMCNLSTINAADANTPEEFYRAVIHAAVIGTLQAAYTDMPYLGPITRLINERDALLGISICGFMDNPELFFNPDVLAKGARLARATNRLIARVIGINHAARVTCVKPEGTASLLLGAASGIHPHHSRRYFRRVQANRKEPVFDFFKRHNPQMTEVSVYNPSRDDCITFPVEAPAKAYIRADLDAERFLRLVLLVQQSWVINGTDESNRDPDILHNVSNTCTVSPSEWEFVEEFIWANRKFFTGVSLLVRDGDKKYPQAPREEVTMSEQDISKWNCLQPNPVDYTELAEQDDKTDLKGVVACAGGSCEII